MNIMTFPNLKARSDFIDAQIRVKELERMVSKFENTVVTMNVIMCAMLAKVGPVELTEAECNGVAVGVHPIAKFDSEKKVVVYSLPGQAVNVQEALDATGIPAKCQKCHRPLANGCENQDAKDNQ